MNSESHATHAFGPNWLRVALLIAVAVLGYAFSQDLDPASASIPPWAVNFVKVLLVAIPVALLCWLLSVRLTIGPEGVRYRSLAGAKEMRWGEVEELYSGAVRILLNGIVPVGTRYTFTLKSGIGTERRVEKVRQIGTIKFSSTGVKDGTSGRELSFGSRFFAAERISQLLNEFTFPVIWRKVSQQYNDGNDVSFGDFTVSRQGVKFNLLGMFPDETKKPIPWADVRSYQAKKGTFTLVYVASMNETKTFKAKSDIARIPNFHVMLALLRQIKPGQS